MRLKPLFALFYTLLAGLIYLLIAPILIILSFRSKYRESIPARFFLFKNPPLDSGGIWFHACSFGEARALKALAKKFDKSLLRGSVTTQTGFEAMGEYIPQRRYLPFEIFLWFWIRPQKALVVAEAELWYLLFFITKRRGAKTFLINARVSDNSWNSYKRFAFFYKRVFENIDFVYAQSSIDKERLEILGAKNIKVVGNIKLSQIPKPTKEIETDGSFIVCGASTHEKEEELILEGFLRLKRSLKDAKLILAPRHRERFKGVETLMKSYAKRCNLSFSLFSEKEVISSDLVLLDTLGELVNIYAISDLVVLGGAFEPKGGHNIVEVAQFNIPVISGENYFNQRELFSRVKGVTVVSKEGLLEVMPKAKELPKCEILNSSNAIDLIAKEIKSVL